MGALIGIVVVALLIWVVYAGPYRVIASKRYSSRQHEVPDLDRFAGGPSGSDQGPESVTGPQTIARHQVCATTPLAPPLREQRYLDPVRPLQSGSASTRARK
jgi:hypothetical protein